METETLNLEQLANILQCDVREVTKMANRGHLPGQKVAGQWRFASAEINHWISNRMPSYTHEELSNLETGVGKDQAHKELLVTTYLTERTVSQLLPASTKASVLKELVNLAEQSWQIYDAGALLDSIKIREEMASTAQENGVALPHPHRPMPAILGDTVIAYGRTGSPIPFGGNGAMCDLFFLVCCRDHSTHLRTLARLCRMLLRPNILADLRSAPDTAETLQILEAAEKELILS